MCLDQLFNYIADDAVSKLWRAKGENAKFSTYPLLILDQSLDIGKVLPRLPSFPISFRPLRIRNTNGFG